MNKETTCCFTGPRTHKLPLLQDEAACTRLKRHFMHEVLQKSLQDKCDTFLCGMALGADMLFASLLLEMREVVQLPLRLVCVLPHKFQTKGWSSSACLQYEKILFCANQKILLQDNYTDGCYLKRNRFMVDHSSFLLALYDGTSGGGTGYTVKYAKEQGLSVTCIDPALALQA
ncbi:SLOG family protein [Christensenella timonensis]|uniref:SLOG family protein n=1 Tax=Christensenella timonensis TaxID=1816678 RepID=UPI00082A44D8|nr:SLOG family protein [Christensenella timonensis]